MSPRAFVIGAGMTRFGKLPGEDTLSLMSLAADAALADAGLERRDVDGVLCGYSTALPHVMLSSVFVEYYGLDPGYAHGLQVGGASGAVMAMLAARLVQSGECRRVLVVAGENRLTGVGSDTTVKTLSGVGHPDYEVPFGLTIPGYYALLASRYLHHHDLTPDDLAELAVMLRDHASRHPKAQFRKPITVEDVRAARSIADPLTLLDCCPISDGGAAFVVGTDPGEPRVEIVGAAQAHPFQHVLAAPSLTEFESGAVLDRALEQAGATRSEIEIAGIYDSFTVTLMVFIEQLGLAPPGGAAAACRAGEFGPDGRLPINTHGGLISFGHCGVGGGMAHLIEVYEQLAGTAGERQLGERTLGLVHGEGGICSSQASLLLRRE